MCERGYKLNDFFIFYENKNLNIFLKKQDITQKINWNQ